MSELYPFAGGAVVTDGAAPPATDPIRVSVMGRDAILRSGLSSHLRASPAVALVEGRGPTAGVVVVATDLIDDDTVAALRALRLQGGAGIVVLASRLEADGAARAAASGACRWLGRWEVSPSALAEAVVAAAACTHLADEHTRAWSVVTGKDAGCPPASVDDSNRPPEVDPPTATGEASAPTDEAVPSLSDRDVDVLCRIAEGHSTAAIADELAYSESTIKNIVHRAVAAFGARNRTHAVSIAIRRGVI